MIREETSSSDSSTMQKLSIEYLPPKPLMEFLREISTNYKYLRLKSRLYCNQRVEMCLSNNTITGI